MDSYEAMRRLIGRDATAIAKRIGRSANLVARWTLPTADFSDSGAYSDLDRLEAMIDESLRLGHSPVDSFSPIHYLAHRFGGYFLPPVPRACQTRDVARQLAKTMKETSEVFAEAAAALDDDDLSANERKRILKEAYEALHELSAFARMIEAG